MHTGSQLTIGFTFFIVVFMLEEFLLSWCNTSVVLKRGSSYYRIKLILIDGSNSLRNSSWQMQSTVSLYAVTGVWAGTWSAEDCWDVEKQPSGSSSSVTFCYIHVLLFFHVAVSRFCNLAKLLMSNFFQLAQSFISAVRPSLDKDLSLCVECFQVEDCGVCCNLDQPDSSKCKQNIRSRRRTEASMDY